MTLQHFRARISQSQINPGSSEETPLGTTRFSLSASSKGPGVLLYHVPFPLGLKDSNGEADTLRPRAAFYPFPQRPPGRRGSTAQSCRGNRGTHRAEEQQGEHSAASHSRSRTKAGLCHTNLRRGNKNKTERKREKGKKKNKQTIIIFPKERNKTKS